MTSRETVLQRDEMTDGGDLYLSFELGDRRWTLTLSDGRRGPSRHTVAAGDTAAVSECVRKAKARCRLEPTAAVHSCYEAGRDGWWLHRWLHAQGIDNIVVDSASIEVNRRARRAKTDRLDGDKLLAMLQRHRAGERVWSVLHEPTAEEEDARRTHRELERLLHERIAHTNRISSLLVLHNLRPEVSVGGRDWAKWWDRYRAQVPPALRAEIERESERLALVLARRLAIALWRYLEHGEIPAGAVLKPLSV
jgi:transposase